MPHIRARALKAEHLQSLSKVLPSPLAQAMGTVPDNFSFELISTQFFIGGEISSSYPFIEVLWFARSQEVQDVCAKIITQEIKKLGGYDDIVVVFQVLSQSAYYENGEHF